MRDNQVMASILFNSNLATADQLNNNWGEITDSRDIGQVLVEKGVLQKNVYEDIGRELSLNESEKPVAEQNRQCAFAEDGHGESFPVFAEACDSAD